MPSRTRASARRRARVARAATSTTVTVASVPPSRIHETTPTSPCVAVAVVVVVVGAVVAERRVVVVGVVAAEVEDEEDDAADADGCYENIKLGAENNTASVAISVNRVKMIRHSRSTTIAANFHSRVTSPDSSSLRSCQKLENKVRTVTLTGRLTEVSPSP